MSKTRAILEAVFDEVPLAEACQACQAGLAAYVDAELAGQAAANLFPAISEHLATCAACRLELAELRSLLGLEWQGRLEQPPVPGEFDFSYLQKMCIRDRGGLERTAPVNQAGLGRQI